MKLCFGTESRGWMWVPGVYFAEGLPFAVATNVSIVMFTSLGMSNKQMALWTSLIALPWSFKFLWAPFLDTVWTKRAWMLSMQFLLACVFAFLAIGFHSGGGLPLIVALFFLTAFLAATHDVAADGYYMIALNPHDQAFYSGFRNIFYKCAMIVGQGGLVVLVGYLSDAKRCGLSLSSAWLYAMLMTSAAMLLIFLWHLAATPALEHARPLKNSFGGEKHFQASFRTFFSRKGAFYGFLFLLFYRFAEAQLGKMSIPFMLAPTHAGGLGLTLEQQGYIYGTAGALCFLCGGFLAGLAVSRFGFGRCFWGMALALNLPDVLYLILSFVHPGLFVSGIAIALEQFGYGLGFMAHILFMVQFAEQSGEYKTSHFAFMTGITILGMTIVGMFSGYLQEFFARTLPMYLKEVSFIPPGLCAGEYRMFFLWICLATIPSFISVALVKPYIDSSFGMKSPTR